MRRTFVFMSLFALAGIGCGGGHADHDDDTPSYIVGQNCPEQITYDGICDGNKVVYWKKNGLVQEEVCEIQCMIKQSYTTPFAECYYECGDLDFRGKCAGNGYDYCNETEGLIHITCDGGKNCGLKGDVYACI